MIIGQSPAIQQVFATIEKVAATDANVLILGENGTGKELVAQALHQHSQRNNQPFVAVDMGALNQGTFESELFGHVKGAFTGAYGNRIGRFVSAEGGTLFLDEIGNLTGPQQATLLRVLQQRTVQAVGSSQDIAVDIRLICATNMPIAHQVQSGGFRQDLLYRINTVEIHLPPLRARGRDIRLLARHFLKNYAEQYQKPLPELSLSAWQRLEQHSWPGNVRELQHSMERLVVMADQAYVEAEDLSISDHGMSSSGLYIDSFRLEDIEQKVIEAVLKQQGGNISHSAKILGLSRAALYRRMEKYGLG